MIIPANRLLWATGITLVPATLAAVFLLQETWLLFPVAGILLGTAVLDAFSSAFQLKSFFAHFPQKMRLRCDAKGNLTFYVKCETAKPCRVMMGISLGPDIIPTRKHVSVDIPSNARGFRVQWPVIPKKRGAYEILEVVIRTPSLLGLWTVQERITGGGTIEVLPNLKTETKKLASLFLRKHVPGSHLQRQLGKGREFEKLRDYIPGDSLEDIHWKATAKRSELTTKEYRIERTQEIYVLIDRSRLSGRPLFAGNDTNCVRSELDQYINSALTLGMIAHRQGDLFGQLIFDSSVSSFLKAKSGRQHLHHCMKNLYALHPLAVPPDYYELAAFIGTRMRKRALLFVLTSLDDPALAEEFLQSMQPVTKRHMVVAHVCVPGVAHPVFSAEEVETVGDIYAHLGGHQNWKRLHELKKICHHKNISLSLTRGTDMAQNLVNKYLQIKQRQLL